MIDDWPITKAEAARRLDVRPNTVGDLCATLRIGTVPLPRNGDGIDADGFERLRLALYGGHDRRGTRNRAAVAV